MDKQLKSLDDKDVLIAPDLGDISAVKFDRSKDAIRIGEEATRAVADKLRRYSLEQYGCYCVLLRLSVLLPIVLPPGSTIRVAPTDASRIAYFPVKNVSRRIPNVAHHA